MWRQRVTTLGSLFIWLLVGCHGIATNASSTSKLVLYPTTIPLPQDSPVWMARMEQFNESAEREHIKLVFLGDSITQGWESDGRSVWNRYYSKRMAMNFGMNRDTTENLLWRIRNGNLQGMNPTLLILLIGVNNTSKGTSVREIAEGVETVVHNLYVTVPYTKILVLGIFPTGEGPDNFRRVKIREANRLIEKVVDGKMSFFIDIGHVFLEKDGTISPEIMPDYLHLSHQGYQLWAEAIEPSVRRLLEESRASFP